MNRTNLKKFGGVLLLSSLSAGVLAGGGGDDFTKPFGASTRTSLMLPAADTASLSTFDFLQKYTKKGSALSSDNLKVSGVTRFLTIYRSMSEFYPDMINSEKNFSFTDYPLANVGTNSNGGYPMLELNLQSKLPNNFDFNVGYSIAHSFTGNVTEGVSQNLSVRQNLNFKASHRAGMLRSTVYAGEILWTNLSRFTMGQPEYRDNYFERLPWDWYRNSFTRYQEYYSLSNNIGQEALGNSPVQGFIAELEYLPLQINFKGIFGRTNRSVALSKATKDFPSYTHGYRLEKILFERVIRGKVGLNFYQKNAMEDFTGGNIDRNTIGSLDFQVKVVNKVNVSGEFGLSRVENQYFKDNLNDDGRGLGGVLKLEFDRRSVLWPFSVEYFYIDKNMASLDGGIINSNNQIRDGGYATEYVYDNMLFANVSAEANQIANNRSGVNLRLEATLNKLKVQFGYSIGQELENFSDTITMQHRVNSFSRSRFRPWFQAGGPYGRIKSFWLRTFETVTIGNEFYDPRAIGAERGNLGFNTIELFLKYKLPLGKVHELVFLNFSSLNSVKEGFNAFGNIDKNTFTTLLYEDFTVAFRLPKKVSLVGNYAIEHFRGSTRTQLSPDIAAEFDAEGRATNSEDRIIYQIGQMYALGVDYDVNKTTSLHLRTKYMTHEDTHFVKDKFSGFETNLELKIFF